jgi:hypothetical protein
MQAEGSQMMLDSGLWGTRGSAKGGPANNAKINAINGGSGYVEMRECHTCHQVGHLARNCPKGSARSAETATAKKSGNFKKKKSGGDQKGQKPKTNTGSYGSVQKARVNALGESEPCDGQQYGEGNCWGWQPHLGLTSPKGLQRRQKGAQIHYVP